MTDVDTGETTETADLTVFPEDTDAGTADIVESPEEMSKDEYIEFLEDEVQRLAALIEGEVDTRQAMYEGILIAAQALANMKARLEA